MVDLVLEAGREQAVGLDLVRLAVEIEVADLDRAPAARPPRSIPGSTGSPPRGSLLSSDVQTISGLMKTCGSFGSSFLARSMVTTRLGTPIWIAASPMPGASYMVSNMSSTSCAMSPRRSWRPARRRAAAACPARSRISRTRHGRDLRAGLRAVNVFSLCSCRDMPDARRSSAPERIGVRHAAWETALRRRSRPGRRVSPSPALARRVVGAAAEACGRPRRRSSSAELSASSSWARRVAGHGRAARQGADRSCRSSVNERLDAVTPASRHLDADRDQAHHREPAEAQRAAGGDRQRAEEHHRPRLAGHVAAKRADQQAVARRVRPGPHGSDHRRTGCRRAPTNSSTRCPTARGRTA